MARGMLNEPIFDTFELVAKTNERLDERIRTLNIRRLPPLPAKMTREWLKH